MKTIILESMVINKGVKMKQIECLAVCSQKGLPMFYRIVREDMIGNIETLVLGYMDNGDYRQSHFSYNFETKMWDFISDKS